MSIFDTKVYGFEPAIQAMRNPLNSWKKSDSYILDEDQEIPKQYEPNIEFFVLGDDDKKLSQKLVKGGSEHRKHLRQIAVWSQFEFPRYIWQEADTYTYISKISCSTMHTLMKSQITKEMFENENVSQFVLDELNQLRIEYNEVKETDNDRANVILKVAKQKLPEGFLQMRSIFTNYECILNMWNQRKSHRMPIWRNTFCDWALWLPYFKTLTGIGDSII